MRAADMLGGGARLVRARPGTVAVWGVVYLAAMGALFALLWPALGEMVAMQQQLAVARAAGLPPQADPAAFNALFGTVLLIDLGVLLVATLLFAAVVRATATTGDDRFAFLRAGMDELRLLGLFVIVAVGWFVLLVAFILVMVLIGVALAALFGRNSPALLVLLPIYLLLYAVSLWALVRLSLSGALTVLRGRIVLRDAWRVTRGRFWTLFGVYLLMWLVFTLVSLLAVAITNPSLLSFYAQMFRPQDAAALAARQQEFLASLWGPRMIVTVLVGAILNTVLFAFAGGAMTTAAIALDAEAEGSDALPPLRT